MHIVLTCLQMHVTLARSNGWPLTCPGPRLARTCSTRWAPSLQCARSSATKRSVAWRACLVQTGRDPGWTGRGTPQVGVSKEADTTPSNEETSSVDIERYAAD